MHAPIWSCHTLNIYSSTLHSILTSYKGDIHVDPLLFPPSLCSHHWRQLLRTVAQVFLLTDTLIKQESFLQSLRHWWKPRRHWGITIVILLPACPYNSFIHQHQHRVSTWWTFKPLIWIDLSLSLYPTQARRPLAQAENKDAEHTPLSLQLLCRSLWEPSCDSYLQSHRRCLQK